MICIRRDNEYHTQIVIFDPAQIGEKGGAVAIEARDVLPLLSKALPDPPALYLSDCSPSAKAIIRAPTPFASSETTGSDR